MSLAEWVPQPYTGFYGSDTSSHIVQFKDKSTYFLWLKVLTLGNFME